MASGAELVHKWAGVWVLAGDQRVPWWIFAVYAVCLFGVGWAFFYLETRLGFPLRRSKRGRAVEAAIMVLLFVVSAALHRWELLLFALCMGFCTARLVFFAVRGDLAVMLCIVVLDFVVESCLAAIPMYHYRYASHLSLPLWLFPFWGAMGLSLRRVLGA